MMMKLYSAGVTESSRCTASQELITIKQERLIIKPISSKTPSDNDDYSELLDRNSWKHELRDMIYAERNDSSAPGVHGLKNVSPCPVADPENLDGGRKAMY